MACFKTLGWWQSISDEEKEVVSNFSCSIYHQRWSDKENGFQLFLLMYKYISFQICYVA
jgi:hypothetical protein